MKFLKWMAITIAALIVIVAIVIGAAMLVAPYKDGPIAMIPGGPLESGELITDTVSDWSFVAPIETIEMQLIADDNRTRTTWVLYLEGAAYIPVTLGFPPGKKWHLLAAKQGEAVVRIEGRRYQVTLVKIEGQEAIKTLDMVNRAKYPPAPGSDKGSWYFRLE